MMWIVQNGVSQLWGLNLMFNRTYFANGVDVRVRSRFLSVNKIPRRHEVVAVHLVLWTHWMVATVTNSCLDE